MYCHVFTICCSCLEFGFADFTGKKLKSPRSLVFFGMTMLGGMSAPFPLNIFTTYFAFGAWFGVTVAILLGMDVMECFLHTLRLHWVEPWQRLASCWFPCEMKGTHCTSVRKPLHDPRAAFLRVIKCGL